MSSMALKYREREEIVGKRFLCVQSLPNDSNSANCGHKHTKRTQSKVNQLIQHFHDQHCKRGTVRASTHHDPHHHDLNNFKTLVDKIGFEDNKLKPIELLSDKHLEFVDYKDLTVFQDSDLENQKADIEAPEVRKALRKWIQFQDSQQLLQKTPSVLFGNRVKVYRSEGTTQWYTAVIVSYNDNTRELTLTDDTVLEEHNEDPSLVQMKLIGDG
ncbi:unnamed protein product, partial [Oppiella nova]